ncbi:MAG: DUF2924 domain-containing protein [Candidatus Glassbacteria bacterium]|nr:DUF2924 domain-containing protein [Candidatus Glassbacteria bacterium]
MLENYKIDVDFEVYKELFSRRKGEAVSFNDVIRELLGFSVNEKKQSAHIDASGKSWVRDGVELPHGTELRRTYKKTDYYAVIENGAISFMGKLHDSPSGAAMEVTEGPVNGWLFWDCKFPGKVEWINLDKLRREKKGD